MKKLVVYITVGIVLIFFVVALLNEMGVITIKYAPLVILLSIFAPITKFFADKIGGQNDKIEEIKKKYEDELEKEKEYRNTIRREREKKTSDIERSREKLEEINQSIDKLRKQKKEVLETELDDLPDEERKDLFKKYYGS